MILIPFVSMWRACAVGLRSLWLKLPGNCGWAFLAAVCRALCWQWPALWGLQFHLHCTFPHTAACDVHRHVQWPSLWSLRSYVLP